MSAVKEHYTDLVVVMRDLGSALIPATAAQYEAPPQSRAKDPSSDVRNPTLEIVMNPRRSGLSDEIHATAAALRQARALLQPHVIALHDAVARWEGQEGPAAP